MKCDKAIFHNLFCNNKNLILSQSDLIYLNKKQQKLNKIKTCCKRKQVEKLIMIFSKLSRFIILIHLLILLNFFEGIVALFLFKSTTSFASKSSENNVYSVNVDLRNEFISKYNRHNLNLPNRTLSNFCYCNYGNRICDFDEICIKHKLAACYHAIKQVYIIPEISDESYNNDDQPEKGIMHIQHFYGCAPLERGSNASHFTCNGWRSTHSSPSSIKCCYEGHFCNMNVTLPSFAVTEKMNKVLESTIFTFNFKFFTAFIFLCIGCSVGGLVLLILICFSKHGYYKKETMPHWMKNQVDKLDNKLILSVGNDYLLKNKEIVQCVKTNNNDFIDLDATGSGSGGVTLNQRTIALDLTILEIVARGRYGEVYKALYRDSIVAVKTFYTTEEESWKNERDIYQTQMLNHENVLQYVAADISSNVESITQMMLITDYHPLGSLYDYLRERRCFCINKAKNITNNVAITQSSVPIITLRLSELNSNLSSDSCACSLLSLNEALQLAHSIISGIEHIHNPMRGTGSKRKPEIVHRDIKSKNVIVKRPGICCVADFGLALRFHNNFILPKNINVQVGTKRYMAPEVLARSLNINNFDEFKAADIYSYSLVLWEIFQMVQLNDKKSIKQLENTAAKHQLRVNSCSSSSGIATSSDRSTSFLVRNFYPLQFQSEQRIIQERTTIDIETQNVKKNENCCNKLKFKTSALKQHLVYKIDASNNLNNNYQKINNDNNDDIKLVDETTNLILQNGSSITKTSAQRTFLLPYQNFIESDPSFEEMFQIVCCKKLRPQLESEWFDTSHPIMQRICELMCECWSENAKSRHTSLKIKKEISNLITLIN